jgi:hypothetical protein
MTNLQIIKNVAKKHNLTFKPTKSTINGEKLYNFVDDFGNVVARNWTISSAMDEINRVFLYPFDTE